MWPARSIKKLPALRCQLLQCRAKKELHDHKARLSAPLTHPSFQSLPESLAKIAAKSPYAHGCRLWETKGNLYVHTDRQRARLQGSHNAPKMDRGSVTQVKIRSRLAMPDAHPTCACLRAGIPALPETEKMHQVRCASQANCHGGCGTGVPEKLANTRFFLARMEP